MTAGLLLAAAISCDVGLGWQDGWVRAWTNRVDGLEIRTDVRDIRPGFRRHVVRWTWNGTEPLDEVTLRVRVRLEGKSESLKPFLPGILMYGNPSNAGRTDGRVPVYAGTKGEFAQFEEHRYPMPFALLEDASRQPGERALAVHVLPSPVNGAVMKDQWWSLGVEALGTGADVVLLSGPIGYNGRHAVAKARQQMAMAYDRTYLTLQPGEIIEKTFWTEEIANSDGRFGFETALSTSLDLFKPELAAARYPTIREIAKSKRDYALTRWIDRNGIRGFDKFDARAKRPGIVIGWTGCAATCGWALPALGFDRNDDRFAQESLDFIAEKFADQFLPEGGLFRVRYDITSDSFSGGNPISCGQGLYSILKAIGFARAHRDRLNPEKWERFARKAAAAMADDILRADWSEPKSTGSGFEIAPLVLAARLFDEPRFREAAEKLAAAFERKYYGYANVYWGGTLDATCEDKEGCYAAFQGYEALLREAQRANDAIGIRRWGRLAEHAMNLMLTYTMVWDVPFPPGRLSDHAFKSSGWTVVSAQNQHLDAFGVLTTPEIRRMGRFLKNDRLIKLADLMYRSCSQLTNAEGSLGEQIQQTNFAQRGDMSDVRKMRGGYQERWTVFWLTAHFLNAAASIALE